MSRPRRTLCQASSQKATACFTLVPVANLSLATYFVSYPRRLKSLPHTWGTQIGGGRSPRRRTVASNICGCLVQNLPNATLLAPRLLMWLTDFVYRCLTLPTGLVTLCNYGWEAVDPASCSHDLASSGLHRFRSLKKYLACKRFPTHGEDAEL